MRRNQRVVGDEPPRKMIVLEATTPKKPGRIRIKVRLAHILLRMASWLIGTKIRFVEDDE